MSSRPPLDLALLQTLVAIGEEGSFTRAAIRIGRTQSAVSLQVRRLESLVGCELVRRQKGGAIELTDAGRRLLTEGRDLLVLGDRLLQDVQSSVDHGEVRLGIWEGYAKAYLAPVMQRFQAVHPEISVEVVSGLSCQLFPFLLEGKLDALVCDDGMEPPGWASTALWRTRLRWITSELGQPHLQDPLPISLGPADCPWRPGWLSECLWRSEATRALIHASRAYVVLPAITTIAGWDSHVLAGQSVTISTLVDLPPGLRHAGAEDQLPALPEHRIVVVKSKNARQPWTDNLVKFLATVANEAS